MKHKLKMSLITWVGLYPTLIVVSFAIEDLVKPLDLYLRLLLTTAIVVPIMVFFILPFLTKLSAKRELKLVKKKV